MYFTTGFKENVRNVSVLARSIDEKFEPSDFNSLKTAYNGYISRYQPDAILPGKLPNQLIYTKDPEDVRLLARAYQFSSKLNDLQQAVLIDLTLQYAMPEADKKIEAALDLIKERDPLLHTMINLVFNYYFLAQSKRAGGGSSSGGLGILWLNPQPQWNVQDYAEMLIHEMTHQLLFIDERCFGHYLKYDKMADPKYFAYSSILNKSRPLDKVIHSLFVALNVLEFRKKAFGLNSKPTLHPSTEKMLSSLNATFESLERFRESMFSPRMNNLLELASKANLAIPESA